MIPRRAAGYTRADYAILHSRMSSPTTTVEIALGERAYPVHIGPGELDRVGARLAAAGLGTRALVVSNPQVARLYGQRLLDSLQAAGLSATLATVPPGERAKKLATVGRLCDEAILAGLDRRSVVVALGGGIVGDLTGFVAACLYRGVDFVQLPTTLVAMVDSSVGGKTGVNSVHGKNLLGAFWQPRLVAADLDTLASLPPRELRCGWAEVIKHGAILDLDLFERLETAPLDADLLRLGVVRSCELKGAVVAADERESGQRAWLNYGHTFGHALEKVCGLGRLHHGEAVAIGMVLAARLGVLRGDHDESVVERLTALLRRFKLPVSVPRGTDLGHVFTVMHRDKKVRDGRLKLVLLDRLGQAKVVGDTPSQMIEDLLAQAGRESDHAVG